MTRGVRLLSCIRFGEVLVLQGAPVMGLVLAMGRPTPDKWAAGAALVLANLCLVSHMWSLNDWADLRNDSADGRKAAHVFSRKGVEPAAMLGLSLVLLAAGLAIFALLSATTFWIAVCLALLSFLYSFPGLHAKSIPLLSSVPHLAGGFLHFLLGYSLFDGLGPNALRIAVVFALVFTAGHGVQEVQDYDGDRRAGLCTNAVVFGKAAVFSASLAAFLFVYGYLAYLAAVGVMPLHLAPLSLLLAALHLRWARQARRDDLSFATVRRHRNRYRASFALLGLSMFAALVR